MKRIHYKDVTTSPIPLTYISMSSHRLCETLNQRLAAMIFFVGSMAL